MSFKDGILVLPGAIPPHVCTEAADFVQANLHRARRRAAGEGRNNVTCHSLFLTAMRDDAVAACLDARLFEAVETCIRDHVLPAVRELMRGEHSVWEEGIEDIGYELRLVTGATTHHHDGLGPRMKNGNLRYRIASLCASLSECDDQLVFPLQDRHIEYKPGTVVVFPSNWTHPHQTIWGGTPSCRLQTWLTVQEVFDS